MAAILAIAADAIVSLDEKFSITSFNDGAVGIFGYSKVEIIGQHLDTLIPERFRSDHAAQVERFAIGSTSARRMGERREIFGRRKSGVEFPAEASIAKQTVGGRQTYLVVLRDVTERKNAETQLARANAELESRVAARTSELEREIARREEAQAALIQAQRMEAVGELTGGIAHDFNNLLTIVTGNLELLDGAVEDPGARAMIKRASGAADMGAALTRRLLTFARRRHLSSRIVDLNELVLGLTEILQRAIGEPIHLSTVLGGGLWPTRTDPSEVENAVLNLAINARDAMPSGGQLVVETRNVAASELPELATVGDCVMLAVSDTGTGMTPEIREKAFEPFFSTKEPGRGTGLGLSTVYGFAKQANGHITLESEAGKGTTVAIYLPRAREADLAQGAPVTEDTPLAGNAETVLVVEDNPDVRELALQRVEGLGYVALDAASGPDAIRLLSSGAHVDLVLTDIVMSGGMSGYDVARWVYQHRPGVKVVLTSGYAAEDINDASGAEGRHAFMLRKPYKRRELAVALHQALIAPHARSTSAAKT